MTKNPYDVLGVEKGASNATCKKAWHTLSKIYHPDCPTGDRAKFDEVQEAWKAIDSGIIVKPVEIKRSNLRHSTLFTFV